MGTIVNVPRKGRPCKLQGRAAAKVGVIMKVNPAAKQETIEDDLAAVGVRVSKSIVIQALKNIGV